MLINLLEKSEIKPLSIGEIGELILLGFNILRSGVSDATKITISLIKDLSSNKLYKFGEENSEYEQIIRDSFETGDIGKAISFLENIFPDDFVEGIKEGGIDTASLGLAIGAGGIDGFLDYIQASVDIVVIPDTILQNIGQLVQEIYKNGGDLINELSKNFTKISDYVYVLSYIVAVVLSFKALPSKFGILALPNVIMKGLQASGKVPANMFEGINSFLTKNIQKVEVLVNNKVKGVSISGEKLGNGINNTLKSGQKVRDTIDSSNTLINSIGVNAKQLKASREALSITNNSLKLAQIFGESIVGRTNETLTTKNAMSVYKEMILKGNGFNTNDIDSLITKTKGEIRYNLVLIREKLMEVEDVIENEVIPIFNEFNERDSRKTINEIYKNQDKYNKLAILIFNKYLPGFFSK